MSEINPNVTRVRVAVEAVALLAASIWLGGILVLGALVAPNVFRMVHAPDSANAMTVVFLQFDRVAMTAAIVISLTEAARSRFGAVRRVDMVRIASVIVASLLAFIQGVVLSPRIASLHAQGAIRNLGELGQALESAHRMSELCGKTESIALVIFVVAAVGSTVTRSPIPA